MASTQRQRIQTIARLYHHEEPVREKKVREKWLHYKELMDHAEKSGDEAIAKDAGFWLGEIKHQFEDIYDWLTSNEWLNRKIEEESHVKEKSKPHSLSQDALLKIKLPAGLEKLESLFAKLEQQTMVVKGTTTNLEHHFTEKAIKLEVPNGVPPIEWKANLYELRFFIRSLKAAEWIEGKLNMIARHFLFNGKTTTYEQLAKGPTGSEKLQSLTSILTDHGIPCQN